VVGQFDEAEAVSRLAGAAGFAGQAAFVEDGTAQVTRGDAAACAQRGTAASAASGQRHRRTAPAITAALWTIGTLTRTTGWYQRLFLFHFGQSKRLTVGSLAQQRSGQSTRAAADIGNQLVEQLAMAGFGIGPQRREAA